MEQDTRSKDGKFGPGPSASATLHVIRITGCARCDGDHEHLEARKLARPFAPAGAFDPQRGQLTWTHWAPCPTNGDPILIMVTADAAPGVFTHGPRADEVCRG